MFATASKTMEAQQKRNKMKKIHCLIYFTFIVFVVLTKSAYSKPSQSIIQLNKEAIAFFDIKHYDTQDYHIQIAIPKNIKPNRKVRVLYTLDGNAFMPIILNLIVSKNELKSLQLPIIVGIGHRTSLAYNRNLRQKDYLPKLSKNFNNTKNIKDIKEDTTSGAAAFLLVIQTHIKPLIQKQFKVGSSMLFGHSFGGIFVLYALLTNPQGFEHYFAASPSLWQEESNLILQHLAQKHKFLQTHSSTNDYLSNIRDITIAKGELESSKHSLTTNTNNYPIMANIDTFVTDIKSIFSHSCVAYMEFAGQNHGSSIPYALEMALKILSKPNHTK